MILKILKPLSFIPALILMYIIFSFSAQDGEASSQISYQVSYEIVEIGGKILGADLQPSEIERLATRFHSVIRKLAHMTEYFALAVAVAFPLYVYGLRGILLLLVAGGLCVAFACGDEYHQYYVAGRSPSKRDVLIDSFGIFWGTVLVRIVGWTGRHTIFRSCLKKKEPAKPEVPLSGSRSGFHAQPSRYPGNSQSGYYDGYPSGRYYENDGSDAGWSSRFADSEISEPASDSDRLSEDMSLRKLMRDLKEARRNRKET